MSASRRTPRAGNGAHRPRASVRPGSARRARLDQLLALAKGKRTALILTHDNPDPDSIAAGVVEKMNPFCRSRYVSRMMPK